MKPEEHAELLDDLLDGSISEADLIRIEAEMSVDPSVRQEYYRRLQLDYLLQQEANSIAQANPTSTRDPVGAGRWGSRASMLAGIGIGLAASLLLAFVLLPRNQSDISGPALGKTAVDKATEPSASGFAVLKGQSNAVWQSERIRVGDLVPTGDLKLKSGTVHLELFSGVQMVVDGTSHFSIDSPMQVTVHSGRARTRVPEPAQGFVVKTSTGDIVDLGTEFAVDVSAAGSEVRVLDGEVELRGLQSDSQRVQQGDSLRLNPSGKIAKATDVDMDLMGPQDFETLLRDQQQNQIAEWSKKLDSIRKDPRLVGHFQFSSDNLRSREVKNGAIVSENSASDGAIVAAEYSTDRWGQIGKALDFNRIGSRVRVNLPGEHSGLTLMCWVKINSLDRWYNSLFLTDGHDEREPHWQIMDDGRIFFSIKFPKSATRDKSFVQRIYYSPPIWDASLSGRWIMLAVTYDVKQKKVTHYFNGKAISTQAIADKELVKAIQVGPASICNWSEPMYRTDAKFVVRNLNGSMDEFSVYSGALDSDEILELFQIGNPDEH